MNLLIVDDEMITVKGLLKGIDWQTCGITGEVSVAYDAAQAESILDDHQIDIILCDIEMPGKSGIELMQKVHEEKPKIVCVFLTCHADFAYAQAAIRLCCQDYILKPAPYKQIEEVVARAVLRAQQIRSDDETAKYGKNWLDTQVKTAEEVQGAKRTVQEIVEDTESYILANLSSAALTAATLAKRNYLNEDYLNRVFKREKGITLSQYIIKERMALAQKLLQAANISISTISMQVGYRHYPHFTSTFKKLFGCTPSQYRSDWQEKTPD
ncbi:MAG: response regulator [Clostridiales bacterium]|nr:response regulator [Clostridiales bacterium]